MAEGVEFRLGFAGDWGMRFPVGDGEEGVEGRGAEGPEEEGMSMRGGIAPVSLQLWVDNFGEGLGPKFYGMDLKLALTPEFQLRGMNREDRFGRLRFDVAIGEIDDGRMEVASLYGVYDDNLDERRNWGVGVQTPYLNPLLWLGIITFKGILQSAALAVPGYVEWNQGIGDDQEMRVNAGLRLHLDWDQITSS